MLARRAEALQGLRSPDEVKALLQEALRCADRSPGRLVAAVRTLRWELQRGQDGR